MKPRPRRIEREVALHLSRFFTSHNLSPVERIPVLGRTGPDITINELGLVIDVKSRLSVPKTYVMECFKIMDYSRLIGVHLDCIDLLLGDANPGRIDFLSASVKKWYEHMDDWRRVEMPDGISALVLHRPGLAVGKSRLIISKNDRRRLIEKWNKL